MIGRVGYSKIGFSGHHSKLENTKYMYDIFLHFQVLHRRILLHFKNSSNFLLKKYEENLVSPCVHLIILTHLIETPKNPNFGYPNHHYKLFWKHKAAHRVIILVFLYLLHIQEWKSNRFPKIITVFTSHFEMFVPFLFNQWVVLNGHGVPHKIFLRKNNQKKFKNVRSV